MSLTHRPKHRYKTAWALLCLGLQACGGGGSSAGDTQTTSSVAVSTPAVEITFPPPNSSLGGRSMITVSGTLTDTTDDVLGAKDITQFQVNGLSPSLDKATGRWSINVPVTGESLEIVASVTSQSGHEASARLNVINPPERHNYDLLAPSTDGSKLYIYGDGALRVLDRASGTERLLTEQPDRRLRYPRTGIRINELADMAYFLGRNIARTAVVVQLADGSESGLGLLPAGLGKSTSNDFSYPDFAVDSRGERLVFSYNADQPFSPLTQCRLIILAVSDGSSSDLVDTDSVIYPSAEAESAFCPKNVLIDEPLNRAIVTAFTVDTELAPASEFFGIYAINLDTGERTTISDNSIGTGLQLNTPERLFATSDPGRILLLDDERVMAVNVTNGNRSLLLDNVTVEEDTTDIAFDETRNALVYAHGSNTISSVSLDAGSKQTLFQFNRAVGTGPVDYSSYSLSIMDEAGQRLLIVDRIRKQLVAIDLKTLQRSILSTYLADSAGRSITIRAGTVNESGSHLYYYEETSGQLSSLDLSSGTFEVISSGALGSGPEIGSVTGISLNEGAGLVYITGSSDSGDGALSVDIATGNRSIVSSHEQSDEEDDRLAQHLFDPERNRLLSLTERGRLLAINVESGNRIALADDSQNTRSPTGMAWDSVAGRVLVLGFIDGALELQSLDLSSGHREVVENNVHSFASDTSRAVIYSLAEDVSNVRLSTAFAYDRQSGERVLIAHN